MDCVVLAFSVVSGLATAAMALFSWRLYRSTEELRNWTVSRHEPEPVVVGGQVNHVNRPHREFQFRFEIYNPGDGPLVLKGVGICRWEKIVFENVQFQALTKLVRPREMEAVEMSLPLAEFPDSADLAEILAPEKRAELIVTMIFLSGNRGVRTTSTKLRPLWHELPFRGLVEGTAFLWPATAT